MDKSDYLKFCRKIPKYLFNLDPVRANFASLNKVIESRHRRIIRDPKNVFVHLKDVMDELRRYQRNSKTKEYLKIRNMTSGDFCRVSYNS